MSANQSIPADRLLGIAEQLLKKTRNGEVRWVPDIGAPDGFVVYLPHSRIRVDREPTSPGGARFRLLLQNVTDRTVGGLVAEPNQNGWDALRSLHDAASVASTRWDEVLNEVEAAVRGQGVVGRG